MTPWAELQNYNVKWEHSVNVVVQMDVHRETGDLLPNELKLAVMQVSCPLYSLLLARALVVLHGLCDVISATARAD